MKRSPLQILTVLLCLCLFASVIPSGACYEAGEPWQVDLTDFLKNDSNREYVEMMLDYYLRSDSRVQQALADGYCTMFFFEGCSDNIDDPALADLSYYRVTAVCIVLKLDEEGQPYIIYFNQNCSTIPDRPLEYGAWGFADVGEVGPATICDGTYELYSVKHMGQYEALHMRDSYDDGELSAVYMTPEGYVNKDANSINIHTRTSNHTSGRGMWSAGCMLVGDGDHSQFMEMMDCTYYSVYDLFEIDKKVGTVTINRQYLKEALYGLYENQDAVDWLLSDTRRMLPEEYLSRCSWQETYREPKKMQTAGETCLMTLPCANYADARSRVLTTLPEGETVELLAEVKNPDGGYWYETRYEDKTCFVLYENLKEIPEGSWFARLWQSLFG